MTKNRSRLRLIIVEEKNIASPTDTKRNAVKTSSTTKEVKKKAGGTSTTKKKKKPSRRNNNNNNNAQTGKPRTPIDLRNKYGSKVIDTRINMSIPELIKSAQKGTLLNEIALKTVRRKRA